MGIKPKYNVRNGFGEIWTDANTFMADCKEAIGSIITDEHYQVLFYLMYARYGNTPIVTAEDENQWKYQIYMTIYTYGTEWEKKLAIQEKVQALDLESGELFDGVKMIVNQAANPSTAPGTGTDEELSYINGQNVSKRKRSKTDAYTILWNLLNSNMNEWFLRKFENFFCPWLSPNALVVYCTDEEDD